jgi:hypothetical protein
MIPARMTQAAVVIDSVSRKSRPLAAEGRRELPGFEVGCGDADDGALQVL